MGSWPSEVGSEGLTNVLYGTGPTLQEHSTHLITALNLPSAAIANSLALIPYNNPKLHKISAPEFLSTVNPRLMSACFKLPLRWKTGALPPASAPKRMVYGLLLKQRASVALQDIGSMWTL